MKKPSCLGVITARGGSKSLKNKNILLTAGKPLIAWTIEAALQSPVIEDLIVSSDSKKIIAVAEQWNCSAPFVRPQHLSNDAAKSIDVILHAVEHMPGYNYVALLQPTCPLRLASDIDAAFSLLTEKGAPSCVSVVESKEKPYWMYNLDSSSTLSNIVTPKEEYSRRQNLPKSYLLNGSIYIAKTDWLLKTKSFVSSETVGYVMPAERSLDIDTLDDFNLACEALRPKPGV